MSWPRVRPTSIPEWEHRSAWPTTTRRSALTRLRDGFPLRLHEPHGRGVHAVAKPCRLRTVVEHMAEMRITPPARNRRPGHPEAAVGLLDDVLRVERRPEARPAGARLELRL